MRNGSDRKRLRERVREDEGVNREGHWFRDFSVRGESWPLIEHWAREMDFHLAAMKGKRRLYYRGRNAKTYLEFVEIRHEPNRIVVSSWVAVGFFLRALTLFLLPAELPVDPSGLKGIRVRRRLCGALNAFLFRLRQPLIAGSQGLHWADLDMSTLVLAGSMVAALVGSLVTLILQMDIRPSLSGELLELFSKRISILAGMAVVLFLLQHFGSVRRFSAAWARYTASALMSVSFAALTILLLTYTEGEVAERKFSQYCLIHYESSGCASALSDLSAASREKIQTELELVRIQMKAASSKAR